MEIKPIELSLSEDIKKFIYLIEWCNNEREKWLISAGISEERMGKPTDMSSTTQKLLTYNPSK